MARLREHDLTVLKNYVPDVAADDVLYFMQHYQIHLKIKRERKAIMGDYRPAHQGKPHTISINATLNPYHFLITFIHELAHLITFLQHQTRVMPHGKEWKQVYKTLIQRFLEKNIFPEDIEQALTQSMHNMSASTCSDPHLFKVLYRYNPAKNTVLVEALQIGDTFFTEQRKEFRMLAKRRTRYECMELNTGHKYLFPGIAEVYRY